MAQRTKHTKIPQDLLEKYLKREITSAALSEATGYSAVYLRRSIKRDQSTYLRNSVIRPRSGKPKGWEEDRKQLLRARGLLRQSLSDLSADEIVKQLNVSKSTAYRIKRRGKDGKTEQ